MNVKDADVEKFKQQASCFGFDREPDYRHDSKTGAPPPPFTQIFTQSPRLPGFLEAEPHLACDITRTVSLNARLKLLTEL